MKTKLLKKAKKGLSIYERNGLYYVEIHPGTIHQFASLEDANIYYRECILFVARQIFRFTPKKKIR